MNIESSFVRHGLRAVGTFGMAGIPALASASAAIEEPIDLPTPSVLALAIAGGAAAGYATYRNRKK
ncbi:hypothetical protein [Thiohalorhabdus methylotrophus]|uniref:PEP-CTERM protein-sorting domain-containing protein n=1 Tax=Thiohalorhabdus methylotrophus TaxID=3242694 RepID=A0ABV4TSQ5_9GAMM